MTPITTALCILSITLGLALGSILGVILGCCCRVSGRADACLKCYEARRAKLPIDTKAQSVI